MGAYHFLAPTSSGEAQAAHFLKTYVPLPDDLPPVLDVERAARVRGGEPMALPLMFSGLDTRPPYQPRTSRTTQVRQIRLTRHNASATVLSMFIRDDSKMPQSPCPDDRSPGGNPGDPGPTPGGAPGPTAGDLVTK